MGLLNTKSQSETAWVEGWSVLSSVSAQEPGWERAVNAFPVLSSMWFLGVPGPGLDPPSAITSSPSRPCFIHELCKNCQS